MLGYRPRVFVSYAHDSVVHKENVQSLARVLRECGVEVRLDQDQEVRHDWSLWALHEIEGADFVVVVASPAYKLRAEGRAASDEGRGSQSEAAVLRDKLTEDLAAWTPKILPVVLPGMSVGDIPGFFQPYAATHYVVDSPSPAGVAELLAAMSVRPPATGGRRRSFAGTRRRKHLPLLAFAGVAVVAAATVLVMVTTSSSSSGEDTAHAEEWREVRRGQTRLEPESFSCTSGVEDKIDLDTGMRGHGVQPQIPYPSCASEGGLADLIVDEGQLHTASDNHDTLLLVPRNTQDVGAAECAAMTSGARLAHTLPLRRLRAGDRLCVRTDKGRVALVTLRTISAGSTLRLDYVVWQRTKATHER